MGKDDFKYFNQKSDGGLLDLFRQKKIYPYEYMSCFEKFKKLSPSKENIYASLIDKKTSDKEYEHVFRFWKDCHNLYLKCLKMSESV